MSNGRKKADGWNWTNDGPTVIPPPNVLKPGPNAAAALFIGEGCVVTPQLPVFSLWIKVLNAVTVSPGVKAQCPARWTNVVRSRSELSCERTTLLYACSSCGSTRPSPMVCIVSTGDSSWPLKTMYFVRYETALALPQLPAPSARLSSPPFTSTPPLPHSP